MRTWLLLFILAPLHLYAQVTRDVRAYNITGRIQEPRQFLWTNILAGANISVDWNANGTITINGGAGGGTNVLIQTNGVNVGSVGTLNFIGATGAVTATGIDIGGFSGGPVGSSITVASNYVITTPAITNLNFVMGTNIFMIVTNNSGDVSVWINVDKFGVTNGLATISYVDSKGLTTNEDQFLGAPLSIKNLAYVTNLTEWATGRFNRVSATNGVFVGGPGQAGEIYSFSTLAGAYQQFLIHGGSSFVIGTNGNTIIIRGTSLYPNDDNTTTFGSATARWKEGWFGDHVTISNALRTGYLSISNTPGLQLGYIELRSTNGNSYTKFSRLDDNWKPTNYFKFSVTNPVAGQIFKFSSVSYSGGEATIVLTNDTDNSGSGSPGGIVGNFQVHGTGGTFVGSTNSFFDVTNNRMDIGFDSRAMFAAGQGNLNITNIYLGRPGILLVGTNHANLANFLAIDDTGFQNSKGKAIHFTFDSDNSSPPNNIARSGLGIVLTNNDVLGWPEFLPLSDEQVNLGNATFRWITNWNAGVDVKGAIVLRDTTAETTGGRTIITHLDTFKPTNLFRFSVTNPVAGQILKFAAVNNISPSTKEIILTNDTDNTGGAGSIAFNPNQFMPSATHTNIKEFYLTTNAIVYSTNATSTNIMVHQFSGASGALLSILNSAGALLTEVNSNGFLIQTNALTNYSRGNTIKAPTNIVVRHVENNARSTPAWTDDEGMDFAPQVSLGNNRVFIITTSAGTAVDVLGITTAVPAGGTTISHPVDAARHLPYMVDLATGTTSNLCAALGSSVDLATAGTHDGATRMSGYYFATEWTITNNIAGIVGGGAPRSFVGLTALANTAMTNLVVTTNATGQYIGLMSDPKQSLDMFISARDSGTEFRTNTGINFVATNLYQFYIYQSPTNRMVKWKLKNITARTEAAGWFSNNVPTNFMKMVIATKNGTNRAHSIRFTRLYLEAPLAPR